MPARLTRVRLRDYRSIASCDVELQPLTLLVGPNGSGKSNFLDSLRFLSRSLQGPLQQVLLGGSGIKSYLRKLPGERRAPKFEVALEFVLADGQPGTYALVISSGRDGAAWIEFEECHAGDEWFTVSGGTVRSSLRFTPEFTRDHPALVPLSGHPAFSPVYRLIFGLSLYTPKPGQMRVLRPPGSGALLYPDASNAVDVLARLEQSHPLIVERIRGYLHSFNPGFSDLSVKTTGDFRSLAFTPSTQPSGWYFNGSEVSVGTLQAIGILLAIFQRSELLSVIGLEEPEANLHPAAAGVLFDALAEASRSVPIIASTHSADLLDRKDLPSKSILAVEMREGVTVIGPITDGEKSILQDHLYTAGELLRSNELHPQ